MGEGSNVLDRSYFQSRGLQGTNSGLTAGSWSLNHDFYRPHAMLDCSLGCSFGCCLSSKGRTFPRTFETVGTGSRPGNGVAVNIADSDDGIVKGGLDMGYAPLNIFSLSTFWSSWFFGQIPFPPSRL